MTEAVQNAGGSRAAPKLQCVVHGRPASHYSSTYARDRCDRRNDDQAKHQRVFDHFAAAFVLKQSANKLHNFRIGHFAAPV